MVKITPAQLSAQPYVMTMVISQATPASASTYYSGIGYQSANVDFIATFLPLGGTITKLYLTVGNGGTAGTSETSSIWLRYNNTTDILLSSTITTSTKPQVTNSYTLSQAVSAGDRIQLKWTAPTYVTLPTSLSFTAQVLII